MEERESKHMNTLKYFENRRTVINFKCHLTFIFISSKWLTFKDFIFMHKGHSLPCGVPGGRGAQVLPAGVEVDFGAGSKLLRGVVALEEGAGAARPAPLGVSLEGRAGFTGGCSSFPKVEPMGGSRSHVNYKFMKNGWTHLPFGPSICIRMCLSVSDLEKQSPGNGCGKALPLVKT